MKNTVGKFEYIIIFLLLGGIGIYEQMKYFSQIFHEFWQLIMLIISVGINLHILFSSIEEDRSIRMLISSIIVPYSMIVYMKVSVTFDSDVMYILFCIAYILILFHLIDCKKNVTSIFSAFMIGIYFLSNSTGYSEEKLILEMMNGDILETEDVYIEDINIVRNFSEWKDMTFEERTELLELVLLHECKELGIRDVPSLSFEDLEDSYRGYYSRHKNKVVVEIDLVMNSSEYDCITVVCHEVYHAYQELLVNMYDGVGVKYQNAAIFDKIEIYRDEFNNYESGKDDYDAYYNQLIESDSREYANTAVKKYID